jgi:hypothetical protein
MGVKTGSALGQVGEAEPVMVVTSQGFDPDSLAWSATYNGDATIATETVTNGVNTWTRTYTYTTGNLTGRTVWVKA